MNQGRSTRAYDARSRQRAAKLREERVLDVAGTMFAENGWSLTTITAIAQAAGVSPDFIYKKFRSKAQLLLAALRHRAFGPHPDLRTAVEALGIGEMPNLESRVDALVAFAARSMPVMAPLIPALVLAADQDDDAEQFFDGMQATRRGTTAILATLLTGAEQPSMALVDELFVLTSAPTYLQFVNELSWTDDRYAAWLTGAVIDTVTRHATDADSS